MNPAIQNSRRQEKLFSLARWVWGVIFMVVLCQTAQASRTVTDRLGRTIVVPHRPERIVSLAPSITEIMFALDKGHLLKGASKPMAAWKPPPWYWAVT